MAIPRALLETAGDMIPAVGLPAVQKSPKFQDKNCEYQYTIEIQQTKEDLANYKGRIALFSEKRALTRTPR